MAIYKSSSNINSEYTLIDKGEQMGEQKKKFNKFNYEFVVGDFDMNEQTVNHAAEKKLSVQEINEFKASVMRQNPRAAYCQFMEEKIINTSKLKYMGDLPAAERLKNDSLCVIDDGSIRNLKKDELITQDTVLVYVQNFDVVDDDNEYIESGQRVRYATL